MGSANSGQEPDASTPPDPEAAIAGVGHQVRGLRKLRGLTLEELSTRASVSIGLISQIERGRGNPSFNTLIQLSHALQVPVGRLFHGPEQTSPVVRAKERRTLDLHGSGTLDVTYELLSPGLTGTLEAVWIEAPPGYDTSDSPFTHPGEEFGIILQGRHQVFLDGVCHELGPGDSITYPSTTPHWYRNEGPETVKAVWVMTPPNL
ncbi:helix-turn-helix domain-containing protein [Streptomyces sp. AF1A]|jgi:transcriptional regulator with XRE-family HTH domain|uniref:helix-turn-helix domain-containing protein n=1 Tax=Streptomyces sp. AF1A TaxID=3394350 RepID=UPI0039BD3663